MRTRRLQFVEDPEGLYWSFGTPLPRQVRSGDLGRCCGSRLTLPGVLRSRKLAGLAAELQDIRRHNTYLMHLAEHDWYLPKGCAGSLRLAGPGPDLSIITLRVTMHGDPELR